MAVWFVSSLELSSNYLDSSDKDKSDDKDMVISYLLWYDVAI